MVIEEINAILTTYWPTVMESGSPQNIYEEKRRAQSAAVIYEVLGPIGSSVKTPEDINHKEHFTLLEIKGMQN